MQLRIVSAWQLEVATRKLSGSYQKIGELPTCQLGATELGWLGWVRLIQVGVMDVHSHQVLFE